MGKRLDMGQIVAWATIADMVAFPSDDDPEARAVLLLIDAMPPDLRRQVIAWLIAVDQAPEDEVE